MIKITVALLYLGLLCIYIFLDGVQVIHNLKYRIFIIYNMGNFIRDFLRESQNEGKIKNM